MSRDGIVRGPAKADSCFQGTAKRSQHQLELEIENMGGHLNAYTSVRLIFPSSSRNGRIHGDETEEENSNR